MQNIDFGKMRHNNPPAKSSSHSSSRLNIYISILIIGFTLGAVSGIAYEKKMGGNSQNHIKELANVSLKENTNPFEKNVLSGEDQTSDADEKIENTVIVDHHSDKIKPAETKNSEKNKSKETPQNEVDKNPVKDAKYVIFAKKYSDKKKAYYDGSRLKKAGYPVFLVKSAEKMKVYIGPIYGKNEAYRYLARIKKIDQYKNAILYRK